MTPLEAGTSIGGQYRLESPLGSGGAGEVFSATVTPTGEDVAIKFLSPGTDPRRLRREIAALQGLRIPGVVGFIADGMHAGRPYIVMERITGLPWPGTASRQWEHLQAPTLGLLSVLSRVHEAGVVHRDLKPGNVLVEPDGRVVMLDFGLARGPLLGSTITASGVFMGTPHYLAPEQLSGRRVGPGADLYAVGVMLFEALAGQVPHPTSDMGELWHLRMLKPPPDLARFSPSAPGFVVDATMRCLQQKSEDRPWSAGDLSRRLQGTAVRFLPDRLGEPLVEVVQQRLQREGQVDVWGAPGSGKSRLLADVAETWHGPVVWLSSGARPLESLHALVGSLSGRGDARVVRAHVQSALDGFDGLLIADDFAALDRASRRMLQRCSCRILRARDATEALRLRALRRDELRALFHGPDRLLHLTEDAAAEVLRRTDGVPVRVERLLRAWEQDGRIVRDGGRFRISREVLDALRAEQRPRQLDPPEAALPDELAGLVRLIRFAHPHASLPILTALSGQEAWELQLELEELVALGAIVAQEDGWSPQWELAAEPWGEEQERQHHRQLGVLLPAGTPGRLEHLLLAGELAEAQQEALATAPVLERSGQAGAAIEILQNAAGLTLSPPVALLDRLVALVVNRGDVVASQRAHRSATQQGLKTHAAILSAWLAIRRGDAEAAAAALGGQVVSPALRLAAETVRMRIAQSRGGSAEDAFFQRVSGIPQDKYLTWHGLYLYRRQRMTEAADSHEAALAHRPSGSARMSALLNAASARMEAADFERAEDLAREGLALAREARHTAYELRAEWILRALYNRRGGTEPDLELAEAATATGRSMMEGTIHTIEGWIAWRGGRTQVARRLAEHAVAVMSSLGATVPLLHARSLACAAGSPGEHDIARAALKLDEPRIAIDVLGILASSGKLSPGIARQALEALGEVPDGPVLGALSPGRACQLIREAAGVRLTPATPSQRS